MALEVSALTRRERLERIASAERDRRAGRVDLAVASLGEGGEWPARIVLALARLPEAEGEDARAILERTLDDWAAESGLDPLDEREAVSSEPEAVVVASPDVEDEEADAPWLPEATSVESVPDYVAPTPVESVPDFAAAAPETMLSAPIEIDELERAFAEAEAQTDEMHDVNDVAERILMDEPIGLAELAGDTVEAIDEPEAEAVAEAGLVVAFGTTADDEIASTEGLAANGDAPTDAAWAEPSVWPDASVGDGSDVAEGMGEPMQASRSVVLATLERWLGNLESNRARRAG